MQTHDFIEVYPDALSKEACALLRQHFEGSRSAMPSRVVGDVVPELKNSRHIQITGNPSDVKQKPV